MQRRHLLGLSAGLLAAPRVATAQAAWPGRGTIRLVATFPPGGLADTISRLVAPVLGQAIGQNVVIENRAGAGGTIGADMVAKAAPDGYTLIISHASPHGIAPGIYPQLSYDPVADFTHLGMLVDTPSALLVMARSPYRDLAQFLEAGRGAGVRYGSSGVGSTTHLFGEVLARDARAPKLDHVPYRGSAPALQDLMSGAIESFFDPLTTNMAMLRDGTLRALAVTSERRLDALPDVPTFAELGLPRVTAGVWIGISGPKGLPAPIAERITAEIPKIITRPDLKTRFVDLASYPPEPPLLGDAYVRMIADYVRVWTAVAREANIVAS
ncbi:tripartite tricarboxylate transporter substrate binding protein [Roseomonas hellenica]|uniref:Tripartite tricarboxylate transporter substrate binding protein n=1 Tax=Plastoroseomonas hellenica TaxID=2687306 RepID=A0ABS5F0L2_9PROT|nr:tripartite tricarboxylate transporter substrate binding protein [Plastoroseomonas hellenica]MBR0666079.1 tripartite tricarboxylate transporter substrate binding protein [Plastoroseomonas hellenica]